MKLKKLFDKILNGVEDVCENKIIEKIILIILDDPECPIFFEISFD
jgi:hypothetical protein